MIDAISYGQIAYEGYCESSDGKSLVTGAILPKWQDLSDDIRVAWIQSALAVRHRIAREITA